MARNSKPQQNRTVKVGNIYGVRGNINIAAGDITTYTTEVSETDIKQLFDQLYSKIDNRPDTSAATKEDLRAEVQDIQSAIVQASEKKEKIEENFLLRRFRNIARMAPDILDVVAGTLVNPLAGLGVAAKKIAEKAMEET
jgi:hypothetical protein